MTEPKERSLFSEQNDFCEFLLGFDKNSETHLRGQNSSHSKSWNSSTELLSLKFALRKKKKKMKCLGCFAGVMGYGISYQVHVMWSFTCLICLTPLSLSLPGNYYNSSTVIQYSVLKRKYRSKLYCFCNDATISEWELKSLVLILCFSVDFSQWLFSELGKDYLDSQIQ